MNSQQHGSARSVLLFIVVALGLGMMAYFLYVSQVPLPAAQRQPEAPADAATVPLERANVPAAQTRMRIEDEQNTIDVVRQAGPSVVAVQIIFQGEREFPFTAPQEQVGGGSGFVVNEQGHIVTNFHVIAPALLDTDLTFAPGANITVSYPQAPDEEYAVRVLGANPDYDLAVLEPLQGTAPPQVEAIPLADSDSVEVGEKVVAIGNPFGLLFTVTTGIVSAIERERPGLIGISIPFIQTDAAINPGNSGGPLLNSSGQVIGINNAILAPAGTFAGVGFAVPANLLRDSLEMMLAGGLTGFAAELVELPNRARLGILAELTVHDYPPLVRAELELPDEGVIVTAVEPNSPADEAGLRGPVDVVTFAGYAFPVGMDVITGIDGTRVQSALDLQQVILDREAGDTVSLTVWRQGREYDIEVMLEVIR